jgi:hypothetical protein
LKTAPNIYNKHEERLIIFLSSKPIMTGFDFVLEGLIR